LRLIFNNVPLEETKTISDYNIENDNVVHLVYKKDGTFVYDYLGLISACKDNLRLDRFLSKFLTRFADLAFIIGSDEYEAIDVQSTDK
jgi:hypothetical protein